MSHRPAAQDSLYPYRIDPASAELDLVDLALSPYLHGTYYDQSSHLMRPVSALYPSSPLPLHRRQRSSSPIPISNKRARIPASSKAILGLKEVTITTMDDDDDCAICLKALLGDPADEPAAAADSEAEMTLTTRLRAMPCSHIFHQHCIFQWLHRNAVCPLCRHQLPTTTTTTTDDDDDDDQEEEVVLPDFWFQSVPSDDEYDEQGGGGLAEEEPRR